MEMQTEKIMADRIREEYMGHTETKLEALQRLDNKVKLPAQIFAFTFGTIGSLVFGLGMCLAMQVIGDLMALGVVVGVVGIIMISVNYLIYQAILKSNKAKYLNQVLKLTDDLLNN